MTVDEVRQRLAQHRAELLELGVDSLAVFGSTARGEAGPESDLDLLVEFNRPVGLYHFSQVVLKLEEWLGRPVDLVMPGALKPPMRDQVLREAVRAA